MTSYMYTLCKNLIQCIKVLKLLYITLKTAALCVIILRKLLAVKDFVGTRFGWFYMFASDFMIGMFSPNSQLSAHQISSLCLLQVMRYRHFAISRFGVLGVIRTYNVQTKSQQILPGSDKTHIEVWCTSDKTLGLKAN